MAKRQSSNKTKKTSKSASSSGVSFSGTPTRFEDLGLSSAALKAVVDLRYDTPTPVQAAAIPLVLEGSDVMAAAQTGTGKTAAFLLPALSRLPHAQHGQGPLMLVVTPTRELAQQIDDVARIICGRTHHQTCVVVGGVGYEPQREALRSGCDLLVATPGRLIDLINQGDCDLSQVETLVLDEADRMLDMGFLPDMRKIVAHTPRDRQTLLFSATLDDAVLDHTRSLVHEPARIEIAPRGSAASSIEQYVLGVAADAKPKVLRQLLEREGASRVIVFTNGKHRADAICRRLRKPGTSCAPIHGNRSQNQRANALRRFADGEVDVLVATDVLARGIDVPDVSYVVNYDVPRDEPESYIHRIGRTGRAGEEGWAITFVTADDYLELRDIEQLMGRAIPPFPRVDGLDLGDDPFEPDPDRDPHEKLPSKKARKKAQKHGARHGKGTSPQHPAKERRSDEDAGRKTTARKPAKKQQDQRKAERYKQAKDLTHHPKPTKDAPRRAPGRRHPGDHGGALRRH